MKKLVALLLAGAMLTSLVACGSTSDVEENTDEVVEAEETVEEEETVEVEEEVPEYVTLTTRNGDGEEVEVTFPYNPQRLAVMDLAALDIIDNIGMGDCVVGVSTGSSIDYLQSYVSDDSLINLGNVKEPDLEAVMEAEPDVIFIGGRMSSYYDELSEIAPVYIVYTDSDAGVVESTAMNATNIASLFGLESVVEELLSQYDERITALQAAAAGKTAIVGMVTSGSFNLLGNDGRCSIIGIEIGFENVGVDNDVDTSEHGNEASFEYVVETDPDYIFVMDRDSAIGTEGATLAEEVMDNELINMTTAAQNGNLIILSTPAVWYTAEGGITALGIMLEDLEAVLLN